MKIGFWQIVPFLLPIIGYLLGYFKNRLRVPKAIRELLENQQVMDVIWKGIKAANEMKGKSDTEKREYVREWAKSELYKLLGEWLPDAAVNFLIELAINRMKG